MMKLRKSKKGFTLVEIMIVVAIIGLLAAIAIPNFVQNRGKAQARTCIANLKQIEGAAQQYLLDSNNNDVTNATMVRLVPNWLARTPSCPAGGTYTPTVSPPTCVTSGSTTSSGGVSHALQ